MTDKINARLGQITDACKTPALREAMQYSLLAGGKRLRPRLLISVCEAICGDWDLSLEFACAVEMIHTYSLIHDDLPAMDDDNYRRGRPSCHIQYGEAMAILAGDALLNGAYEVMAGVCYENNKKRYNKAMAVIAGAAGAEGMVAGQALDMMYETTLINARAITDIYNLKAGRLISACMEAGAIIGNASPNIIKKIKMLGDIIGISFQVKDDILEATSTEEKLGKPIDSDIKNKKNTFVSLYGLEKAIMEYEDMSRDVLRLLGEIPQRTSNLQNIITEMIERDN